MEIPEWLPNWISVISVVFTGIFGFIVLLMTGSLSEVKIYFLISIFLLLLLGGLGSLAFIHLNSKINSLNKNPLEIALNEEGKGKKRKV